MRLLRVYRVLYQLTYSPRITNEFHSLGDASWYNSAYLLACTIMAPTWGKVYQMFALKSVYILNMMIFILGSLLCALAHNSTTFIMGRAIAGLGAAGTFSGGLTIVAYMVPLHNRAKYSGLLSIVYGVFRGLMHH